MKIKTTSSLYQIEIKARENAAKYSQTTQQNTINIQSHTKILQPQFHKKTRPKDPHHKINN